MQRLNQLYHLISGFDKALPAAAANIWAGRLWYGNEAYACLARGRSGIVEGVVHGAPRHGWSAYLYARPWQAFRYLRATNNARLAWISPFRCTVWIGRLSSKDEAMAAVLNALSWIENPKRKPCP